MTSTATAPRTTTGQDIEHLDVLIVGAGISGIDAAHHLQQNCPGKSFALLETQGDFGGTWRTHDYPGIRSDSDLYTFGYKWKPWTGAPIAAAPKILAYLDEALEEQDIRRHIRYRHEVRSANWSGEECRWSLVVARKDAEGRDTGDLLRMSCNFLWMCQGYYRHSMGYTPEFAGMKDFEGKIVHPQHWPQDLDHRGKRMIVIGSGATAATIIPAVAGETAHVTMLQRSPTYFMARPNRNELADLLRELDTPPEWTHEIVRRKILHDSRIVAERSFKDADALRKELIDGARAHLGPEYDVDTHFNPDYRPWQQRLAWVPDGDLFQAIRSGKASVVTDEIDTFTAKGIRLKSGQELEADIIVTATGFDLCVLGDIAFKIDGKPLDFSKSHTWRGVMYSEIPNMAWVFGYFRSSWTLRADLIAELVCRLLNHMDAKGVRSATPTLRAQDRDMPVRPFIEPENFNPGYLMRSIDLLPRQGDKAPWVFDHDYYSEKDVLPVADLDDGSLVYR